MMNDDEELNPEEAWGPTDCSFLCPLCKKVSRIWGPGGRWPLDENVTGGPVCQHCDHEFKHVVDIEPFFNGGRDAEYAAAKERMVDPAPVVKPKDPQGSLFD